MKYCSVPTCKNNTEKHPNIVFFRLPRDASIRDEWLEVINYKPNDTSNVFVCENHFQAKDFKAEKKELKPHAVPQLNLADGKSEPVDSEEEFMHLGSGSETEVIEVRDERTASSTEYTDVIEEDEDFEKAPNKKKKKAPVPVSRRPSRKAALVAAKRISNTVRSGHVSTDNLGDYHAPSRHRAKKVFQISNLPAVSINLQMDCVEEFLSPAQAEYLLKSQTEYNTMMKNLRDLASQGVKIIHEDDHGNRIAPLMPARQFKITSIKPFRAKNITGPVVPMKSILAKKAPTLSVLRPLKYY